MTRESSEDFAEYSYFDIEESRKVLMLVLILFSQDLQDIWCPYWMVEIFGFATENGRFMVSLLKKKGFFCCCWKRLSFIVVYDKFLILLILLNKKRTILFCRKERKKGKVLLFGIIGLYLKWSVLLRLLDKKKEKNTV